MALRVRDIAAPEPNEQVLQTLLQCELVSEGSEPHHAFILQFTPAGLTLFSTAADAPGGLCVDLLNPALRRRTQASLQKQDLGKALGIKPGYRPSVLDATAGLGSDAFLMASAGCQVAMLERHPVVFALLQDALTRARACPQSQEAVQRMQLQLGDFLCWQPAEGFDVVYLDPMFPKDRKSARSGKGMYLLQEMLDGSGDEQQLLSRAVSIAGRRVVVKRAKLSPHLSSQQPDISFRGSSSRYDVYLCKQA